MNNKAVGVFDSGVGGLTVVWELMRCMPDEDIVYFGDTARVPYGSKSPASIRRFAVENASFLLKQNIKMIVVACNTATAIALPLLRERFSVPVVGVVDPGAKAAAAATVNGRIGVIGTHRTVSSGAYADAIRIYREDAQIFSRACPLFVPLIEENWIDHPATELVVREYLDPLLAEQIDTLVLGCTHYPLLKPVINRCYPRLQLVDSATSTAQQVAGVFERRGWLAAPGRGSQRRISVYLSDYTDTFQYLAERILRRPLTGQIHSVGLEEIALSD